MNTKLIVAFVLLSIAAVSIAKQCYKCSACPKPFAGNKEGVSTINVGDNDYCQKTIILGVENRDTGGSDCTPVDQVKYCCQGNLCNGAITTTLTVKLLATTVGLLFFVRFFQ